MKIKTKQFSYLWPEVRMRDPRPYGYDIEPDSEPEPWSTTVNPDDLEMIVIGGPNYRFDEKSVILLAGRCAQLADNFYPRMPGLLSGFYYRTLLPKWMREAEKRNAEKDETR